MEMKWWIILGTAAVLVIAAVVIGAAIKNGYKARVFSLLYELVAKAESYFEGSGRGAEKKAWVVEKIHDALPKWAKAFVSEKDIDDLLELAVDKMKELLETEIREG